MTRRLILIAAVLIVLMAGAAGAYMVFGAGAGTSGQAGAAGNQDAAQQFFAERGGKVFTNTIGTGGTGFSGGAAPGAAGSVEKVEGDMITVKDPMNGTTSKVHLAADAKITKDAAATAADIKVGDSINAIGQQSGDSLAANVVTIGGNGGSGALPGGVMQFNSAAPGGSGGAMPSITAISGKVTKIDGQTITVEREGESPTTVQLSENTQLRHPQTVDASAITPGVLIFATGSKNGDVFEATAVQVTEGGMQIVTK